MVIVRLAWRNIFRHKIRTLLTAFTIFAGVFITLFGNSVNQGLTRFVINQFIRTDIGIVRILPHGLYKDIDDKEPVRYNIENASEITEFTEKNLPGIQIARQIFFMGELTDGINEIPVIFYGVDEKENNDIFGRKEAIIDGEYFSEGSENIIISSRIASLLGLKVGSFVTIMGKDSDSALNAIEVRISGIFSTGNIKVDNNYVFLPMTLAEEFTGKEKVNEIILMSENSEKGFAQKISSVLEKEFKDKVDIIPWYKEIDDFLATMDMKEKSGYFFMGIIFFMAAFGIANTLIMAVYERKREIGILYALGFKRTGIISLFVFEGVFTGLIGGLTAGLLSYFLSSYFSTAGISINMAEELTEAMNFGGGKLYTYLTLKTTFLCVFSAVCVSGLASLYPAWFATRLNPADIIRQ